MDTSTPYTLLVLLLIAASLFDKLVRILDMLLGDLVAALRTLSRRVSELSLAWAEFSKALREFRWPAPIDRDGTNASALHRDHDAVS